VSVVALLAPVPGVALVHRIARLEGA